MFMSIASRLSSLLIQKDVLGELLNKAVSPSQDTRSSEFFRWAREQADIILEASDYDIGKLDALDRALSSRSRRAQTLAQHLIVKLALSKACMMSVQIPLRIAIVVPTFREMTRIRPRGEKTAPDKVWNTPEGHEPHPNGEDFVYEKAAQIDWLKKANPLNKFVTIYMDDGCNQQSALLVRQILEANNRQADTESVYELDEIIKNSHKDPLSLASRSVSNLNSATDSKKSGSVYAGMALAIEDHDADIIVYTDADLSYDLGMVGSLVYPIITGSSVSVVANRRHERSFTEDVSSDSHDPSKRRMKALIGSLRAYLFEGILPRDTQAGFKAFRSDIVRQLIEFDDKNPSLAFDVQLLARVHKLTGSTPMTMPIVCIDSPEETTADQAETYRNMVKTYIDVLDELKLPLDDNQKTARFILEAIAGKGMDHPQMMWNRLSALMRDDHQDDPTIFKAASRIRRHFFTESNNTASSLPITTSTLEDLKSIVTKLTQE